MENGRKILPGSHQGRDEFEESAEDAIGKALMRDRFQSYLAALGKSGLEISFDVRDTRRAEEISRTFKMMIKAAVVQINGAYHGLFVI